MVVQDTKLDRMFRTREYRLQGLTGWASPLHAIEDFMIANSAEFEIDRSKERFIYSQHTKGFIKRVAAGGVETSGYEDQLGRELARSR